MVLTYIRGLLSCSIFCTRGILRTFNLQRFGIAVPRFSFNIVAHNGTEMSISLIMKKLLLTMLLMAMSFVSYAEGYAGILVTMVDGSTATISFDENPVIKLQPEKLIVKTDVATTEFDRSAVARFNYVTDLSGVEVIEKNDVEVVNKGGVLSFANLPTDSEIKLYSVDGKLLKNVIATGSYTLELTNLSTGVYILNVNGVSTKIAK